MTQIKMFFIVSSGCHEVQSALAGFFQMIDKVSIWCYNIIGDNSWIISHLLQLDHITTGYVLLTANLVAMKRGKFWFHLRNPSDIELIRHLIEARLKDVQTWLFSSYPLGAMNFKVNLRNFLNYWQEKDAMVQYILGDNKRKHLISFTAWSYYYRVCFINCWYCCIGQGKSWANFNS